MQQNSQWIAVSILCKIFRALPHYVALKFGAFLGALVWMFSKKRVDKAEARCVKALGVGPTIARGIVRRSYENHGRCVAEFIRLPSMGSKIDKRITLYGEENLRKAFSSGKGVILLSAHIGNWEVAASFLSHMGYPVNAIGADQRDSRFTDLIVSTRESSGVRGIAKGANLKSAFRCLKRGEVLAILLDQDAKQKGMIVPFLGLPASTPQGPVKIASRVGSSIVPVFCVRKGSSEKFDLHILPSLDIPARHLSDEETMSALLVCNECLSKWISKYPDQWMWLYPRWASTLGDR